MPDDESTAPDGAPFQMKINFLRGTISGTSEVSGSLDVSQMPDQSVGVGTVTETEAAESIPAVVTPETIELKATVPTPDVLAEAEIELSDFDAAFLDNLEIITHSDFRMRVLGIPGQPRVHIVVTDAETGETIYDGIEPDDGLGWGEVRTLEQAFVAVWQKAFGVDLDDA